MIEQVPMLFQPWATVIATQYPCCLLDHVERIPRALWIELCATRLGELDRGGDASSSVLLASDLWADVGLFDPVIAAEIEHESRATCT